ncbi:MAG: hypothetical protein ABFS46_00955 [Myxococcota bacterium]
MEKLDQPGDLITRLRQVDLAGLKKLRVRNLTTGAEGSALRIFPNGSFDAFVRLEPGENHLVVEAHLQDGAQAAVERRVVYQPTDSAFEQERLQKQLLELEARTAEIRLWAEMEQQRRAQRKVVEVEAVRRAP